MANIAKNMTYVLQVNFLGGEVYIRTFHGNYEDEEIAAFDREYVPMSRRRLSRSFPSVNIDDDQPLMSLSHSDRTHSDSSKLIYFRGVFHKTDESQGKIGGSYVKRAMERIAYGMIDLGQDCSNSSAIKEGRLPSYSIPRELHSKPDIFVMEGARNSSDPLRQISVNVENPQRDDILLQLGNRFHYASGIDILFNPSSSDLIIWDKKSLLYFRAEVLVYAWNDEIQRRYQPISPKSIGFYINGWPIPSHGFLFQIPLLEHDEIDPDYIPSIHRLQKQILKTALMAAFYVPG